jgi:hypothetical protein
MKYEIGKVFYCSAGYCAGYDENTPIKNSLCCLGCNCKHRRHPTPKQYKEEYGEEYELNRPVWILLDHTIKDWQVAEYKNTLSSKGYYANRHYSKILSLVCACTPFGKPDDN